LSWGQPLGFFEWDDWEESYNNVVELQALLEKGDATVLHPITRIQLRKKEGLSAGDASGIENAAAPVWIVPQDLEMNGIVQPLSGNKIWTDSLRDELQGILLSIRVMQALSIYVRQYTYSDEDEDEVPKSVLTKYLYVCF